MGRFSRVPQGMFSQSGMASVAACREGPGRVTVQVGADQPARHVHRPAQVRGEDLEDG